MLFASGLTIPEGPVLLPDGSFLCVEMPPDRGCVTHVSTDGQTKRMIAETGRPNGLAVDKDGILWVAESMTVNTPRSPRVYLPRGMGTPVCVGTSVRSTRPVSLTESGR